MSRAVTTVRVVSAARYTVRVLSGPLAPADDRWVLITPTTGTQTGVTFSRAGTATALVYTETTEAV